MAVTKTKALTYESLLREVQAGGFRPVYYLMGEESYYIDRIADYIVEKALTEEERAFNLITVFGADTTIEAVMDTARAFPMGAPRMVVCVKEAQNLKNTENLEQYLRGVQPSTVLIFCHKNGSLDRRKKLPGLIEKAGGVVFESAKLRDYQLPSFIQGYMQRKRVPIDPQAVTMMAEHVGADLNRMASELDKLCIAATDPASGTVRTIDAALVAAHIGISKDYNIFELQDALVSKNVGKAMRIADYFERNPKENPIQKILPSLFRFFSTLMMAYYCPDKTENGLAQWLNQSTWQVRKNVLPALRSYSGMKVMQILTQIRRTDARSKGIGNPSIPPGDLMKELLFFVLH